MVGPLPWAEALERVEQRADAVAAQITALTALVEQLTGMGSPQLAWIEPDYGLAVLGAECDWLHRFAAATRDGTVGGYRGWEERHR